MYFNKTILICEDNLKVLSKLLDRLFELEQDQPYELSIIALTNHQQVEDYINTNPKANFDIVLLDRDCKLGRSFHCLDIERFGVDKVIAISSVPEYNLKLQERGVKRAVLKDYADLDNFTDRVIEEVEKMIRKLPVA